MKRRIARQIVVLVSVVTLAACGGGGGGGTGGGGAGAPAATFTRTVELPTGGFNWSIPFVTGPSRAQMLVRTQDIGGAGPITSVAFRLRQAAAAANSCPDVTITLGHTSKADLEATYANNVEEGRGGAAIVLDGPVSIPAGAAGDDFAIPFAEPFLYNGVDNLVVDITSAGCNNVTHLDAAAAATPYTGLIWGDPAAATGSTSDSLAHLALTFAGGDNALTYTAGASVDSSTPFTSGGTRKLQALYLAAEIDGRGPITAVGFPVGADTSTAQTYTVTVRLGHSTQLTLSGTYADAYSDTPVTVASDATFVVPAGLTDGTYVWLPMPDGTFTYNGVDNLVVEVDASTTTGLTMWRMRDPSGGLIRLVSGTSGGTTAEAGGIDWVPDVKFRFAGGTMDVPTSAAPTGAWTGEDGFPFKLVAGKRQYLYLASELGSAGSITKLACRLFPTTSTAATYPNYEVVMGHTTATALGATYAANMTDGTTVFSGSVAVPAGLRRGDWVEIPLSTPFAYNGRDHLVVQIAGDAGPESNTCLLDATSATRYADRRLFTGSPAGASGTLHDSLVDMRFFLQ